MSEFKLTINDTKTGKSYNKVLDTDIFKRKKLRDKIAGDALGLKGYELEIRGGSDTSGFPMRENIEGVSKKKALLTGGVGVTIRRKGARIRKTVRGNEISLNIAQINLKIVKYGSKKIEDIFGAKSEETEEKKEVKKEVVKEEKPKEEKKEEPLKEKSKVEEKKEEKVEEKSEEEKK
ncbi:MAG: 30S ribosomal protein S6e [Nanoarchaeota archaeon]|nr:30S ribosomal protein S6e [Nanoarchaeota archaeon]